MGRWVGNEEFAVNAVDSSTHLPINECRLFVWVIWTLVFGAYLGFGAWKLVLQSYQLLKVILDRSGFAVRLMISSIDNRGLWRQNANEGERHGR